MAQTSHRRAIVGQSGDTTWFVGPRQHQVLCVAASTDDAERPRARVGILASVVLDMERVLLGTAEEAEAEEAEVVVHPRTSHLPLTIG